MAARQNYDLLETGPAQIHGLLLMAKVLHLQGRPALEYRALLAIVERAPDNPAYQHLLEDAQRTAGLLFDGVHTEAEAEPPRACFSFTVPPSRRPDWQPADWIALAERRVPIRAMGGHRPLTFLVDGAPIASDRVRRDASWTPPGPGFYRLTVIDADGQTARAEVRVQ